MNKQTFGIIFGITVYLISMQKYIIWIGDYCWYCISASRYFEVSKYIYKKYI